MSLPARPRICIVAAVPLTFEAFLAPHLRALAAAYDVTVVASRPPRADALAPGVAFESVPLQREIAPASDLRAAAALYKTFRRGRYDLVVSITPKAGLIAMTAARLARVPVRVHWFTGQVWATRRGASRALLKTLDRVLVRGATHLLADSRSQRDFLAAEGIAPAESIDVLGEGSVSGVDLARFRPDVARRAAVRARLGIPDAAVVVLFVGRLTRDKGVVDLAAAFDDAARDLPALHLVLVGPDEANMHETIMPLTAHVAARVHVVPQTSEPEVYMAASDIFALPSYREGFGSTVIEAAACGLPALATRIYGLTDAVSADSGILVGVGDIAALSSALRELASRDGYRQAMGLRARVRVARDFSQERLTAAFTRHCEELLQAPRAR